MPSCQVWDQEVNLLTHSWNVCLHPAMAMLLRQLYKLAVCGVQNTARNCTTFGDTRCQLWSLAVESIYARSSGQGHFFNFLGDRSFVAADPRLWNSLSVHLRKPDLNLGQFWRTLKPHLFVAAWQRRLWLLFSPATDINVFTYLLTKYV